MVYGMSYPSIQIDEKERESVCVLCVLGGQWNARNVPQKQKTKQKNQEKKIWQLKAEWNTIRLSSVSGEN